MHLDAQTFFSLLMNGLASGSMLFIVACGLSLIFGVTQIVNFAHGSFYMLGAYIAYTLTSPLGRKRVWFLDWRSRIGCINGGDRRARRDHYPPAPL